MPEELVQISVGLSPDMKTALDAYVAKSSKARPDILREAIANVIGYDLSQEPTRHRGAPRVYASLQERAKAQRERNKERRRKGQEILADLMQKVDIQDIDELYRRLKDNN